MTLALLRRFWYIAAAVLMGWLLYTSLLSRSAVKDQASVDVIAQKDAQIAQLRATNDSIKQHSAKAETTYVAAKATSDARKPKTTASAEAAQIAVRATGDSVAIKALDSLVMAVVIERRTHIEERAAADSVIASKTLEVGNLTSQLATVMSRAEDQRRLDHRAVLREKARGGVAVVSASGGAIVGAVIAGPLGAGIGAAVGGIAALVVNR